MTTQHCRHGGAPCPRIIHQAYPDSCPPWCQLPNDGHRHERDEYGFLPSTPERVTPIRVAGLTVFLLALFAVIVYALPVIGEAALR